MKTRRCVRISMSAQYLIECLQFPPGTALIHIRDDLSHLGTMEMVLSHDDLPEVQDGDLIPHATPSVRIKDGQLEFDSWGVEQSIDPLKFSADQEDEIMKLFGAEKPKLVFLTGAPKK